MTNTVGLVGCALAPSNWRPPARRVLIHAADDPGEGSGEGGQGTR